MKNFIVWFHSLSSRQLSLAGALLFAIFMIVLSYIIADPNLRINLVMGMALLAGVVSARMVYAFKMKKSIFKKIWRCLLTVLTIGLVYLSIQWKVVSDKGGEQEQEPFRIADHLYYVGTKEMTSFLLTSSKGHILIDGGYPGNTEMIIKSINKLGFKLTDVKIMLNTHAHGDHAGGLAALQKASGAALWISEPDAELISNGGAGKRNLILMNLLIYSGLAAYPAPRIDHVFKDGSKIRLGELELTAHITPGHTPGSTTWTFPVNDGKRKLLAVNASSLTAIPSSLFGQKYDPQLQEEFRSSFKKMRAIPAELFLAPHASFFNMYGKLSQRKLDSNLVNPFIDRKGYLEHIDKAEKQFNKLISE